MPTGPSIRFSRCAACSASLRAATTPGTSARLQRAEARAGRCPAGQPHRSDARAFRPRLRSPEDQDRAARRRRACRERSVGAPGAPAQTRDRVAFCRPSDDQDRGRAAVERSGGRDPGSSTKTCAASATSWLRPATRVGGKNIETIVVDDPQLPVDCAVRSPPAGGSREGRCAGWEPKRADRARLVGVCGPAKDSVRDRIDRHRAHGVKENPLHLPGEQ